MASSILSSSTAGRVVSIRPETSAENNSRVAEDNRKDELEFDNETGTNGVYRYERGRTFSSRSFSTLNRTSEAIDFWHAVPYLDGLPTQSKKYEFGKRAFDIGFAILVAPFVGLAIGIIALLILMTGGPVFYRQRRIGQHGREFYIWKFRTMRHHADRILTEHLKHNADARDEWFHTHKLRNDPRITRLGSLLRKASLDELPQILNVISGDMSFVGPRPIVRAETVKYAERFPYYLAAVPGITGLWQVSGRCNVSYDARVILDETYVCKWSLLRDIWILLKTPRAVCHRDGAY